MYIHVCLCILHISVIFLQHLLLQILARISCTAGCHEKAVLSGSRQAEAVRSLRLFGNNAVCLFLFSLSGTGAAIFDALILPISILFQNSDLQPEAQQIQPPNNQPVQKGHFSSFAVQKCCPSASCWAAQWLRRGSTLASEYGKVESCLESIIQSLYIYIYMYMLTYLYRSKNTQYMYIHT